MGEEDFRVAHDWLCAFAEITQNLLCASDTFVAVTGYTIEDCATLPSWRDLIVESDRSIAMDQLRVLVSGKDTENETRILRKQGDVRRWSS